MRDVAQAAEPKAAAREASPNLAGGRTRLGPWIPLSFSILFNLWVLHPQLRAVQNLNDSAMHLQMIRWAMNQVKFGRIPLDGWYPNLQLGSAHFRHYQSLPHVLTGYLAVAIGATAAFHWTLYLLLALWPLDIYLSARLFGLSPWTAGATALLAPLLVSVPGLGFEQSAYVWQGSGVWSQLWGMWMLPLAWALTWRAVTGKGSFTPAVAAVAFTIAVHFLTGYEALLALPVWALTGSSGLLRRAGRAVAIGCGGVACAAWVVVPLLADSKWILRSIYFPHTAFTDSYGGRTVLGWLVRGQLFDGHRLPVITLLVAAGVVVSLSRFRQDELGRGLVAVTGVMLVFFIGRPTFGPLFDLAPMSRDLLLSRFIAGFQLGGLFLAGIGAAWLAGLFLDWVTSLGLAGAAGAAVALTAAAAIALIPAWSERVSYARNGNLLIQSQAIQDRTDGAQVTALIHEAESLGGGRIYAGSRSNWGRTYEVGAVPVYAMLANDDADAVGFTLRASSLSEDVEAAFDETNPAQYNLFDIRYLLLPADRQPSVRATLLDRRGRHTLWTVGTTGYLQVVDTVGPAISADAGNLASQMQALLSSPSLSEGMLPTVAFGGSPAATPTAKVRPSGPAGEVDQELDLGDTGTYGGQVRADRPAVVLLKASFDPGWQVFVDGARRPPVMVAPSFVGVDIPAGSHTVLFQYRSYTSYPALFLVSGLVLVGFWLRPRWTQHIRRLGHHRNTEA